MSRKVHRFSNCLSASWSPDGTMIAYTREFGIHVVNADTGKKLFYTRFSRRQYDVKDVRHYWSPDSSVLAVSKHNYTYSEIQLIYPSSKKHHRLKLDVNAIINNVTISNTKIAIITSEYNDNDDYDTWLEIWSINNPDNIRLDFKQDPQKYHDDPVQNPEHGTNSSLNIILTDAGLTEVARHNMRIWNCDDKNVWTITKTVQTDYNSTCICMTHMFIILGVSIKRLLVFNTHDLTIVGERCIDHFKSEHDMGLVECIAHTIPSPNNMPGLFVHANLPTVICSSDSSDGKDKNGRNVILPFKTKIRSRRQKDLLLRNCYGDKLIVFNYRNRRSNNTITVVSQKNGIVKRLGEPIKLTGLRFKIKPEFFEGRRCESLETKKNTFKLNDDEPNVIWSHDGNRILLRTQEKIYCYAVCRYDHRMHHLFNTRFKRIVFHLMCIRQRRFDTIPMEMWLIVFEQLMSLL